MSPEFHSAIPGETPARTTGYTQSQTKGKRLADLELPCPLLETFGTYHSGMESPPYWVMAEGVGSHSLKEEDPKKEGVDPSWTLVLEKGATPWEDGWVVGKFGVVVHIIK